MLENKKTTERRSAIMRRALAIFLCLTLVVSYVPVMGSYAYATDDTAAVTEEHTHDHDAAAAEGSTGDVTEDVTEPAADEAADAVTEETSPEEEVIEETETQDPAQVPAAMSLDDEVAAAAEEAQAEEMIFFVYDEKGTIEEYYADLKAALEFAGAKAAADNKVTVMLMFGETFIVSGTKGSITTVPENVELYISEDAQLLLPFKDAKGEDGTAASGNGDSETRVAWAKESQYLNQKLVVDGDIYIEEGGKLTVAGLTGTKVQEAPQGQTSGSYSQMFLSDEDSDVIVDGELEVFGLVNGTGDVILNHGAVMHVPFYIADFGGGTNILESSKTIFPAQQYGMNSVQAPITLNYGADIAGVAKIYAALEGIGMFASTGMVVIGHGDGIIDMQPGSVVKIKYVENNIQPDVGALEVSAYGNATIGSIQSEIMGIAISSDKKYISIPYNWSLTLHEGNYSIPDEMYVKFMPGSKFVLGEGAHFNLKAGSKVLVYDGFIQSGFGGRFYPSTETLQNNGYSAAAQFVLAGGSVYVDAGATFAGTIQNTGVGKVTTEEGAILQVGAGEEEYIDGVDTSNSDTRTSMKLHAKYWDGTELVNLNPGETIQAYPSVITDPDSPKYSLYNWTMDKYQTNYWMDESGKHEISGGYVSYKNAESRTGTWNIVDVELITEENLDGFDVELTTDDPELLEKGAIGIDGTITVTVTVKDGYTINGEVPAADNYPKLLVTGATAGKPAYSVDENGVHTFVYTVNQITGNVTVDVDGVADNAAPTGEVSVTVTKNGTKLSWLNQLIFKVADWLNVNVKEKITITAADKGSGIKSVEYYVSNPASENHPVDKADLIEKAEGKWVAAAAPNNNWATGVTFDFDVASWMPEENEKVDASDLIVYVKITDKAGNVTYISSGGMRYDNKAPVVAFNGVVLAENPENPIYYYHEYNKADITITDQNWVSATIQIGEKGTPNSIGAEYTVEPLDKNVPYIVKVKDDAGNSAAVTFYYVKPLTVKFESYDGTSQIYSQQHYGATIEVPTAKEPASGDVSRQFEKWVNTAEGSTETLQPGDTITVSGNAAYRAEYTRVYKATAPAETAAYKAVDVTEGTYFEKGATYSFKLENKVLSKYCKFTVTANGTVITPDANGVYSWTMEEEAVVFEVTTTLHDLVDRVLEEPTCSTYGKTETYCQNDDCSYSVVDDEVPMLAHSFDKIIEEKLPTCTEDGYTIGTCRNGCTGTVTSIIPATGHTYEQTSIKDATCTESGLIVKTCTVESCGKVDQFYIPAAGHNLTTIVGDEVSDCLIHHFETTACSECDYEKVVTVERENGKHTEVEVVAAVAPTCETEGNTIGTECSACGTTLKVSEKIAPLGHDFVDCSDTAKEGDKAATCTTAGLKIVAECSTCKEVRTKTIDALGHDYKVTTQNKTCTQDGFILKECQRTNCGHSVKENEVKATGHNQEAEIPAVAATCYAEGATAGTKCSACGEIQVAPEAIGKVAHVYDGEVTVVPATCVADGYKVTKCSNEGCTSSNVEVVKSTGHNWGEPEITRAAECGQIGIKTTKCKDCTKIMIEPIVAKTHEFITIPAVEPTCDTKGLTAGEKCELCGYVTVKQEEVKALAHDIKITEGYAATCTETGLTDEYKCVRANCGKVLKVAEEIPAAGHKFGDWKVTKEAACETSGEQVRACTNCDVTETETIKALGHSYDEGTTVEPTCTTEGKTTSTCTACGDTKVETFAKVPHKLKEPVVADPTCTETGLETGTCETCDMKAENVIPAKGHSYKDTVVAPTCTEKGYTTHTCETCGHTYKDSETKASHTIVTDEGYEATCTEPGLTDGSHCEVCGEVIVAQEIIEANGHSYKKVVTAPTCTEKGYTTYTCGECHKTYKDNTTQEAGHKFSDWTETKAATCTVAGQESRTCGACDVTETRTVDALGHTSKVVPAVAATCENAGLTEGSECSVCGEVLKAQKAIEALGHEYKATVTAPTCTEEGYTTHSCTRCDDVYTDSKTAAIGHAWKDAGVVKAATCTAAGIAKEECVNCGETQEVEIAKLAHKPEVLAAVDATCIKTGLTEGSKCSECGTVLKAQEVVAKADHVCDPYDGKEPTCTSRGYEPYEICRICDYTTYKELPAKGHSYTETVVEATCTEAGSIIKVCKCGYEIIEAGEPAKGHTVVEDVAVEPTCTETGKTAGSHCSECGEVIKAQETVPAKGHSYGEEQYQKPTAEADGGWYKVCADCGDKQWTKVQTYAEYVKAGVNATTVTAKATASIKTETITLTWTKSAGYAVTHYEVYRSRTGKAGSFAKIGQAADLKYEDKTAKPGIKYYYKVRGVRVLDDETFKTQFSNVPTAKIKKVTASYVKESKMVIRSYYAGKAIKVTWTSPRVKVDGYEIWRSHSLNGTYKKIKTTGTAARQWTNTGLKLQDRWYYKVRGYKLINGKKVYTQFSAKGYRYVLNAKNAKLANAIEDANAITAKKATKVNGGIKVTWSKDTNVKCNRYEVWRSTSKNGTYTKIATTKNMSYTDKAKNLKKGKRYYYKVVGYRFFGKACPKTKASNVVSAIR